MPDGERNEHLQRTLTAGQPSNPDWTLGGPAVYNLGGKSGEKALVLLS